MPHIHRSAFRPLAPALFFALSLLTACVPPEAAAQTSHVTPRGTAALPSATTDQFGQSFTIAGLSGITYQNGNRFLAVMDNSNKLVFLDVQLAANGAILSVTVAGGLTLAETRDFEGIAYTDALRNSVWLSEEGTPAVHEFSLANGARLQTLPTPPVFANRRANFGFESMTRRCGGGELWTANEEALTVDGPVSTPSNGTTVRLLRYQGGTNNSYAPAEQYAYLTQPMHGGPISSGRSGLVDLVELPDGTLLALERSLAFSLPDFFQDRLYVLDFAGATDVSGLTGGLIGQTYMPVTKALLWSGGVTNMEGLTLGPQLANGNWSLLGIVDDGDPISVNTLVAFELSGVGDMRCPEAASPEEAVFFEEAFEIAPPGP